MEIIPKFYIFGVPDGFDLLDGTTNYVTYFQKFYISDSKENTKFSIHRDAKGSITYTYLKYNLSSCNSRAGSFFGMSLGFQNVYCGDPLSLFKLFDMVYNTYVLIDEIKEKEGKAVGFIRPIKGNKDIQARYDKVTRFQDKRDYIQHYIENVLLANINDNFKDDFYLIDNSFTNEQPDLVVQEPLQSVSNERLLADLRQFNRVAVSPDWLPEPDPDPEPNKGQDKRTKTKIVLAPEYIVSLLEYTKGYQNYIIDSLNDIAAADIETAHDVYKEVITSLKKVKTIPSTDKRVSQIIRDYTTLTEQLQNLIQKIEDGPKPPPQPPIPPTPPTPWWKNPKVIISGAVGLLVMIISIFAIVHHYNKKADETIKEAIKASQEEQIKITIEVRKSIQDKDYKTARRMVGKIDEPLCAHLYDSIVFCELSDQTASQNFKKYTDIWEKNSQEFSNGTSELRKRALDTVANRRWRYIETLVTIAEHANTNKDKKEKKKEAQDAIDLGKNTELHNETNAKSYETRLKRIVVQEGTGGNTDKQNNNLGTTSPAQKQYMLQICRVYLKGDIDYKWKNNPDLKEYRHNETLNGNYFYYRLMQSSNNGQSWTPCGFKIADQHISASDPGLMIKGDYDGAYKILKKAGKLSIKDGTEVLFTITIHE